ncbi:MAG: ATP-dependent DNA helicase [Enterococcus sp.]|nr:ATP-dependent DNA helicase [Enterococcus sp.]
MEKVLTSIHADVLRIAILLNNCEESPSRNQVLKAFTGLSTDLSRFLVNSKENVRWAKNEKTEKNTFRKKKKNAPNIPCTLHCAPLRIGPRLMRALDEKKATMIGTSATIKVAGRFDSPVHELSLNEEILEPGKVTGKAPRPYKTVDVGTPFDYARQAMLFIPDAKEFPSPDYKNIDEHSSAVEEYTEKMVARLGGRALILLTTTRRVSEVGEYLEAMLPTNIKVLKQGDAPSNQLIEQFVADETSVLVATMGMWHGLNASGPTCSLVIMDKIPFASANDPLMAARKNYADEQGRNGFMEVSVAKANVKLAQGFGRLVRSMSDRGVVAIFDTRLQTKAYGRAMLKSLPDNVSRYSNLETVLGSLGRLRDSLEKK